MERWSLMGMLVNLMVDHDWEKLSRAWRLSKAIKLPVCLGDLELDSTDRWRMC